MTTKRKPVLPWLTGAARLYRGEHPGYEEMARDGAVAELRAAEAVIRAARRMVDPATDPAVIMPILARSLARLDKLTKRTP